MGSFVEQVEKVGKTAKLTKRCWWCMSELRFEWKQKLLQKVECGVKVGIGFGWAYLVKSSKIRTKCEKSLVKMLANLAKNRDN